MLLAVLMVFALSISAFAQPLMVYSSVDEENARAILEAFTKSTGIQVQFVHLSSGPALARLEAEKDNPMADIWMGAPSENHVLAKERGLTQPYKSPNAAALDPKFVDPEGYWTSFYMNPMGVAMNTAWAARAGVEAPESWYDLLKPEFAKEIQMPTPQSSGTAYNLVASLILAWGEDEAFAYLKELNKNIQTYTQSGTAPSQAVAIGEAGIGIQFTPAFLKFMDEGYPLQLIFPKEGVGYEAPAISIVKGAPNFEDAKKLVDWIISVEAQNLFGELKTYFFPVHPEAVAGEGLPSFNEIPLIDYDAIWAGEHRQEIVEKWIDEVLRGQ
ncbi:MAG TPA: ABC transporter substrate-binding protein [Firmicutes bacterium]|jgi:iron(III) transport system substrate-binding protein|nr:ABC transporter substrate-binding protein [Limnochordia bacterium]HAN94430.1 ABC transporter substrate-binding protein [Bacillota bacterium]